MLMGDSLLIMDICLSSPLLDDSWVYMPLEDDEFKAAESYVLLNCKETDPFIK